MPALSAKIAETPVPPENPAGTSLTVIPRCASDVQVPVLGGLHGRYGQHDAVSRWYYSRRSELRA